MRPARSLLRRLHGVVEATRSGSLYRYAANGGIVTVLDDVTISNGLAWHSGGDRMYYIDTTTQRVDVVDPNDAGEPVTRRTAFTVDPAHGANYPPALRLRHHRAGQIFAVGLPVGGPPAAPYRG
jgi:hypothetical protein